jgi:hypothetical protein
MMSKNKILCFLCAIAFMLLSSFAVPTPAYADENTSGTTETTNSEGCKYSELQKKYMEGSKCWYCMVVGKMTGAYLYAASLVIPTVKTLALLVLRIGFLIWLALYILKQVSSISPTSVGKFLQEILIMGFKVMLATLIIKDGTSFINTYIMTPIIDTGIDIGNAIFDQIALDPAFNIEGGS